VSGVFTVFVMKKNSLIQSESTDGFRDEAEKVKVVASKDAPSVHLILSITAQFCFYFATSCVRTNLPINLQNKYGTSVSTMGYLNSLQSCVGTLIGFTIGPVLKHVYKGNNRRMVVHAGTLEVVSVFRNISHHRISEIIIITNFLLVLYRSVYYAYSAQHHSSLESCLFCL